MSETILENDEVLQEKDIIRRSRNYNMFVQHKDNRTLDLSSAKYKKLEESIRLKGENKVPIIVNENSDGTYTVIEGHHRLEACKATNSVLRFVIDNEHSIEDAIEQECLTFSAWKNMSLFEYGVKKQVPICLFIQDLYAIYQDAISLDNLIQISTRFLSRRKFNLKGKYPSHDGIFKKLKTQADVEKLQQMTIYEEDKIRVIEAIEKFIEFYSYASYKPSVKDVEAFISMFLTIQPNFNIIVKNWQKMCKNKDNYNKYPKVVQMYDKIKGAKARDYDEGINYLMNMSRLS